jgi:hypothetical protein
MHKFEAYYIDNLVGKELCTRLYWKLNIHFCFLGSINSITVPRISGNKQAYFERSPINFVDKFSCPVILFQGLEDTVRHKLTRPELI